MSRRYDRRPKWKRAVYAGRPGMTDGCRVLLLRLLDDMNAQGIVSIPRSKLATELGVAPARISERVKLARSLGFLSIVRRARPQVTAVYQATIPDHSGGTESVPLEDGSEVRPPVSIKGTDDVPLKGGSEVRMYPTQVVTGNRNVPGARDSATEATEEGDGCGICHGYGCPRCIPDESEAC